MWQGGTAIQDGLYNIETGISSLPTPKREGYVFNGWYGITESNLYPCRNGRYYPCGALDGDFLYAFL